MCAVNNPHHLATHQIEHGGSLMVAVKRQIKSDAQEKNWISHAKTVAQRMVVATKAPRLRAFGAQVFARVVPRGDP